MAYELEYNGKIYTRNNAKWVDADSLTVSQSLQIILDSLAYKESDVEFLSYSEAKAAGDRYKQAENYHLAIKLYERALKIADHPSRVSFLLPRMTACYRKLNKPRKVIDLLGDAKCKYGEEIISEALLTSAAAAFCDLGEPENAIRCCKWGYRVLKKAEHEKSSELSLVFTRANKMLNPDYSPDDDFDETEREYGFYNN